MLEKTLESPLDYKEIKPVNPKGNQPWIFIGRTDAEAEAPILWPPDAENWLIRKDHDSGKMEDRKRRGWQRWLDSITDSIDMSLSKLWEMVKTGKPGMVQSIGSQRVGHWATEQQRHLPSASAEIEPCAAAVVDLQQPLKEIQGGEWGTLCSRETGGAGLWIVRYFQEWISWSHSLHFLKKQRNQRSNCQYLLDHRKSKSVPEKCLLCFIDNAKDFDCVDHSLF